MTRRRISTALAAAVVAVAGGVAWSGSAWAHAMLEQASPAAGSDVKTPPPALALTYSEAVEPRFSSVTVKDAGGTRVDQGTLDLRQDGHVLLAPLKPLAPGVYTVEWHVTSIDTHKTSGHFTFTVSP